MSVLVPVLILAPSVLVIGGSYAYQRLLNRTMRKRERELAPNPLGWNDAVQEFTSDVDMPVEELEVQWQEGNRCECCGRIVRLSRARRLRRAWVNHSATCPIRGERPSPIRRRSFGVHSMPSKED